MAGRRFRDVSPELRQAAQGLRREMTEAERLLWNGLRGWKLGGGVRFRRQHALGRFVLDFYCPAHRLCVEVDGEVHETQRERDAARDEALASVGIRTLRFPNEDVFADLPAVLRRIERELTSAPQHTFPLPLAGEGGASQRAG